MVAQGLISALIRSRVGDWEFQRHSGRPSQIGRHFVVGAIGNREVAGETNLDAVAFADGDGRQNVQGFVEDALRSLAQTVANAQLDACVFRLRHPPAAAPLGIHSVAQVAQLRD